MRPALLELPGHGSLFQQYMGDPATQPEGVDPGEPGHVPARPGHVVHGDLDVRAPDGQVRIGLGQTCDAGDPAVLQHQHRLDQAHQAGCRFEVADVGLDRADPDLAARACRRGRTPVRSGDRLGERGHLDRVTAGRARSVRLEKADVADRPAGRGRGTAQQTHLRVDVGTGEAAAPPVVCGADRPDHRVYGVAVGERPVQPLEQDARAPLAPHVAVPVRAEGHRVPGRRQCAAAVRGVRVEAVADHARSADQGHRVLVVLKPLHREPQGGETRRAGRVDHHARSGPAELVGDTVGAEGRHPSGEGRTVGQTVGVDPFSVVGHERPDEHRDRLAVQAVRIDAGVLHGMPGQLQHHPVLRIHPRCHPRGNAEEAGVEGVDPVEQRRGGRARQVDPGIQPVPASLGNGREAPLALLQHVPQRGRRFDASRTAGHADDRDRYEVIVFHRGPPAWDRRCEDRRMG